MPKAICSSTQATHPEDRGGGGEGWQLAMGEQSRLLNNNGVTAQRKVTLRLILPASGIGGSKPKTHSAVVGVEEERGVTRFRESVESLPRV